MKGSVMVKDYYADVLHGEALETCYALASPRIQQYLKAEINFVQQKINGMQVVLELGCGYGRVLTQLNPYVNMLV